jgi:hypothetical protein
MTRKITIEQNWHQQSEAAKSEAEKLPHGKEREALVRKARQLHTASQINEWLSSPGLQPPDSRGRACWAAIARQITLGLCPLRPQPQLGRKYSMGLH